MPRPRWERVLPLELCLGAAAIGLCIAWCLQEVPLLVAKARDTERLVNAHDGRHAWIERMAQTGERPDAIELPMGLRPAWLPAEPAGNLLWLCGDRAAPAGWQTLPPTPAASSATTHSVCREGAVRW